MKPKKSLGQNFLRDKNIIKQIIEAAELKPDDVVLEIGPGEGILTEALTKKAGQIFAVEIDQRLMEMLQKKFANHENVEFINANILELDLANLLSNQKLKTVNYKLISNIPYYITQPIIRKFLETKKQPTEIIIMVQKEVAENIIAKPSKMGILSVAVQYYAATKKLFNVPREAFFPIPEVDSAVIKITPNKSPKPEIDKHFFSIVRAGFCAKRKTLVNNLSNSLHIPKREVEEKIKTARIDPAARAQELSIENWQKLATLF